MTSHRLGSGQSHSARWTNATQIKTPLCALRKRSPGRQGRLVAGKGRECLLRLRVWGVAVGRTCASWEEEEGRGDAGVIIQKVPESKWLRGVRGRRCPGEVPGAAW